MKRDVESPAAYLADLEGEQARLVERIRGIVLEVAPEVEEGLRYGMLDYPGLCNLAAQKHYVALYVAPEVLKRHKSAFPKVDCGKSCLRFKKLDQAAPERVRSLLIDVRDGRAAGATGRSHP